MEGARWRICKVADYWLRGRVFESTTRIAVE